jgi:predicted dehydrogenase
LLKVLVVGLGAIGQRHVRNLRAILGREVDILAYRVRGLPHVVTPSLDVVPGSNVEAEYDIRVFGRLEDALADKPSIALICNPTSLHVPVALMCVRAGCDLFIEKPVSNDLLGLSELIDEVRRHGRIVMVGYQLRFHPCFRALERLVSERSLGLLLSARAVVGEYLPGWHSYEDYRAIYASRADLGGGVILTQIHEFDYLYALFGLPRRLFAIGGHLSHLEVDVEDVASTLMEFNVDGRILPVHLQQDYLQRPPSRSCEVLGSRGKVLMDLPSVSLTRHDGDGVVGETGNWGNWNRNQAYRDELQHFLDCVQTRREPVVDLVGGIASLRMALAAKESIATGRVIELEGSEGCAFGRAGKAS